MLAEPGPDRSLVKIPGPDHIRGMDMAALHSDDQAFIGESATCVMKRLF